jgi:hypothetical protein
MDMEFLSIENARKYAQERANATGWQYSLIQSYNPHLKDYVIKVRAFNWKPEALEIVNPNDWV